MEVKKLALFASGSGSNVQNIIEYFSENKEIIVDSVWTNNPNAFVLERVKQYNIESFVFTRDKFRNTNHIVENLLDRGVDLVVLAGFLWLIPDNLIKKFRIINIHPALLPQYGGKGMNGMNFHQ